MTTTEGTSMNIAILRAMCALVIASTTLIAMTDLDKKCFKTQVQPQLGLWCRCASSHGLNDNRWMPDFPVKYSVCPSGPRCAPQGSSSLMLFPRSIGLAQ
jgi:hypothetical protein